MVIPRRCRCERCERDRRDKIAELRKRIPCEHVWSAWKMSGTRTSASGKLLEKQWTRACELCREMLGWKSGPGCVETDCPHVEVIGLRAD